MFVPNNKNVSIEYNTRLTGFADNAHHCLVSLDGKIKTAVVQCPQCGRSNYVHNGYHVVENSFICKLGLNIKIAQFTCKKCGCNWSTERELIDGIIQREKDFLKSLLLGCARCGLSLESASALVKEKIGDTYSPQYLHELYSYALGQIKQENFSSASGVYYYDEQYIKVNGQEACRLAVRDAVTGKIVFDVQTADAQDSTIERALRQKLYGLRVEVFIVDLAQRYPDLLSRLYPKVKIQWCIFHLYKLIWKEVHEEFGKEISLQQQYNIRLLFNIFFDHTTELKKLETLLEKFNSYKFNDPKMDRQVEHCLLQEFSKFIKDLKRERRRSKECRKRRTSKQSTKIFTRIKQEVMLFPKSLQKRIRFIDENWKKFTLFQNDNRVQPTNNGVEQYFGATLSKTEKKDFRSKAAVARELRACQAEWNGQELFSTTKLVEIFCLVGLLFRAFAPT